MDYLSQSSIDFIHSFNTSLVLELGARRTVISTSSPSLEDLRFLPKLFMVFPSPPETAFVAGEVGATSGGKNG